MKLSTDREAWYLSLFEQFQNTLNGKSNSPIQTLRKEALRSFTLLGFPTPKDEAWKNISLASLLRIPFALAKYETSQEITLETIQPFVFDNLKCTQLVFIDGLYAPHLSSQNQLPEGLQVENLANVLDSKPVSENLGHHAKFDLHAFTALNTAFVRDGAFILIPEGMILKIPIHLLFISTEKTRPSVSHPRVLILAKDHSQASIIESYAGSNSGVYFTNAVTEIVAGNNAVVDHTKLELESHEAFHFSYLQAILGRQSSITSHLFSLGGALVRNDINALLAGEGCKPTLNGFYLLQGKQQVDNYTLLEHTKPGCPSHELYKGILGDDSRAIFRGKIHVHQNAQKTDAYQSNQNLLLSDRARINTKPQLEIYADEVKCSHGATIGQLDKNALFYLQSRGIRKEIAYQMLLQGFAREVINKVKIEPVRKQLDRLVQQKFENIQQ